MTSSFIGGLCRKHRAWAVDMTRFDELPRGWRESVSQTFDSIGAAMAGRPGQRLGVVQVKEKYGGLRIYLEPLGMAEIPATVTVLTDAAERLSFETCDACGAPGALRYDDEIYATRCDRHAMPGSVRAPVGGEGLAPGVIPAPDGAAAEPRPATPTSGTRRDAGPEEPRGRAPDAGLDGVAADGDALRVALYDLGDVAAAAGSKPGKAGLFGDGYEGDPAEREPPAYDTEHGARLQVILDAGEAGRWRALAGVPEGAFEALDDLGRRAPHLDGMTDLVRRHLRAAATIGLSVKLPPVLLLGPPGVGKTWYMSRLAALLGLPFRTYPMNAATLGEGLQGAHPNWRNAQPGLVSKTLLQERMANPLIVVDEVDKAQSHGHNADPYRPFYTFLEPSGAKVHVDEYLGFPMDASAVSWVLAGNDASPLPEPILDRLTILTVPAMDRDQVVAVARSIYAEANAARRAFFDPEPGRRVLDRLAGLNPRSIRIAIEDAMVTAAAVGRRAIAVDDLRPRERAAKRRRGLH